MGTRSLTIIREDGNDNNLVQMYRHFDGYPAGHGKDLYEFLRPIKLVNGLTLGDNHNTANGFGCLAAQLVAHFKTGPGWIYLTNGGWHVDYHYVVYEIDGQIEVQVNSYGAINFEGTLEEFGAWTVAFDEEI